MNEKRYSEKFKHRMIQRLVGPNRVSAKALSKEVGVCQTTLSLWLRNAGSVAIVKDEKTNPPARRPEDWTPKEKLEAEGMAEADLGLWLRRKGLKLLQQYVGDNCCGHQSYAANIYTYCQ